MFEECRTTTEQGNVGEAAAILHFTKLKAVVSKPLIVNNDYDLIVDIKGKLNRLQIKTTQQTNDPIDQTRLAYVVNLKKSGCNARKHTYSPIDTTKVDLIYVLADDGTEWVIPSAALTAKSALTLNKDYDRYKV